MSWGDERDSSDRWPLVIGASGFGAERIFQAIERKRVDTPGEIRTPDPLLRRQVLYPAELRAHN